MSPAKCPVNELPFKNLEACFNCRYYDKSAHKCYWYSPPKPMEEILTIEERLLWLEGGGANDRQQ